LAPLAVIAGPVVDLGVPAAGPVVAAGLLCPVVVAGPVWPEVAVAAVVAADLHSLLLAWPLLLVLVLLQLVVWLLLPLLWLQCPQLSWLLLLLVQLILQFDGDLPLCLIVIGFGPCSS